MIGASEELDVYLSDFAARERNRAAAPPWLSRLRKTAMERFADLGFPTTRMEDWRFTSVAPIAKTQFQLAAPAAGVTLNELLRVPLADLGGPRLVFVNGRFAEQLSSIESLGESGIGGSLARAVKAGDPLVSEHLAQHARCENQAFVALNTAFLEDGAFLQISKGAVVKEPIHIIYAAAGSAHPFAVHPRTLVVAGRDSQASIVESYFSLSDGVYFTNAVSEIVAGENAVIEHYKLQHESLRAFHVATLQVLQERSSSVTSHSISAGGALVRNDINAVLAAEGAECSLNGLYIVSADRHVDNHTAIDHAKPHCSSRELYKGILDGRSTAVFNGKIIVRKDAQKTDAKQTNKNLLLSSEATINTKPQLEIYADDVKCTHGATVGQLGEELIFYLRSRGIGYEDARTLLTYAFASDVTARMKAEPIRAKLDELLLAWLRKGRGCEAVL
jgi:Fe-S cluster assembly protein SufD